MKTLIYILFFAAAVVVQSALAQDSASVNLQSERSFGKVITDYLDLKNALTKDNADSVSSYAKILSADIHSATTEKLSADKHKIWDQYYEGILNHSKKIESGNNLKDQREHFAELSPDFYKMIKEMKVNISDLYYQYCPMADAYWVSEKSKISNPYLGKKMPACGSTKETLKANQ